MSYCCIKSKILFKNYNTKSYFYNSLTTLSTWAELTPLSLTLNSLCEDTLSTSRLQAIAILLRLRLEHIVNHHEPPPLWISGSLSRGRGWQRGRGCHTRRLGIWSRNRGTSPYGFSGAVVAAAAVAATTIPTRDHLRSKTPPSLNFTPKNALFYATWMQNMYVPISEYLSLQKCEGIDEKI